MSQIYKAGVASTPSVPTSFTTDATDTTTVSVPAPVGTAVPQANVLQVTGLNGITTYQPTLVAGVLEIGYLGNKVTTTDATPTTILTISPINNSGQAYQFLIVCYDAINALTFGGQLLGVARVNGGAATAIELPVELFGGDAALSNVDFTFIASGANVLVQVQGIVGHTLDWAVINAAGVITAT